MAINDTRDAGGDAVQTQFSPAPQTVRRAAFPAIRWGAILAGVAVGISVQLVLTLLGIASGLSSSNGAREGGLGTGPLIWAGISMMIAAFFGGYVAARMSGLKRRADGVLHGAVSWAVTTIMFVVLAASVGGTLLSGVFNNMNQLTRNGTATTVADSPLAGLLRLQGVEMTPQVMRQLQQYLLSGQRERAVQLVAGTANVEQARAETIVDQALIVAGASAAAAPRGRAQSRGAPQSPGTAAWVVFLTVALALAIGIVGGSLGAAGSRRVSWTAGSNASS